MPPHHPAPDHPLGPAAGGRYRVAKDISFCYGHRLLDYDGKCRHLHGHNGTAVVVLETADLDARGMAVDFGDVKRVVGQWIDANLDHRMLLRHDDPAVPGLLALGEPVVTLDANPTAENIARLIFAQAVAHGLPVVEVTLWETPTASATVRAGA